MFVHNYVGTLHKTTPSHPLLGVGTICKYYFEIGKNLNAVGKHKITVASAATAFFKFNTFILERFN